MARVPTAKEQAATDAAWEAARKADPGIDVLRRRAQMKSKGTGPTVSAPAPPPAPETPVSEPSASTPLAAPRRRSR